MLRTLSKTTLLAGVLATSLCFGLIASPQASAQHRSSACSTGACSTGACSTGACPTCGIGSRGCGGNLCDQTPNCRPQTYGQAELFYNYYMPSTCGGVPAQMYLSPRPVPAMVGYTYYTYQPLMPHEMLYQHHRTYHRYYDNGRGMNRTSVSWYRPPLRSAAGSMINPLRIAR